jgi:hypothetical protein
VFGADCRPSGFDTPDAVDNDLVIVPVRTQVQRHTDLQREIFISGQKKAVQAKVVKPDGAPINSVEHRPETSPTKQLARQKMMSLKPRNMP